MATSIIGSQTTTSVATFEKSVYDDPSNKVIQATDIGYLRRDTTRLNVMGKLDKGDKEDFYKLRVQADGKFTFAFEADGPIRFQVKDLHGRVIADSKADMGEASKNYEAMQNGTYDAAEGTLIVHVMRDPPGGSTDTAVNYNIQASMGERTKDYVTWEVTPPAQKPQPVMSPVVGFLSRAASSFSSLFR